jgi:cellulose synthase/poly-beta-1,6-N-acetylglucosamine synthase-like glycosyltransferase
LEIVLLSIYGFLLCYILTYSFVQLSLVLAYRQMVEPKPIAQNQVPQPWPMVTVQLPVYNEKYVVERLIDAVAKLDYPADRIEIQVLDDSTDESVALAARRVAHFKNQGCNITHVVRNDRTGFKAGALAHGLSLAKGELIAIFDADFIPYPDFLKRTVPSLNDPAVGMVQTRWGHLNAEYSLLTRLQAFGLDAHFTVEQGGRNRSGHFMNFNGTAGVWRKQCIINAGGWQHDTLTEDLDLSYRAQLKGWKFMFLEDVIAPAELPAEMNALKSQQFRWTKGAAECAVKNLPAVFAHPGVRRSTKLHALFHLMNSSVFIVIFAAAVLSVPVLWVRISNESFNLVFNLAAVFLLSLFILMFFYRTSSKRMGQSWWSFLRDFPLFLSLSMGLSLHNSIAVLEGYTGRKSAFIRTPKYALERKQGTWANKQYRLKKPSNLTLAEGIMGLYFVAAMVVGAVHSEFGLFPFHAMLCFGFLFSAVQSYRHIRL